MATADGEQVHIGCGCARLCGVLGVSYLEGGSLRESARAPMYGFDGRLAALPWWPTGISRHRSQAHSDGGSEGSMRVNVGVQRQALRPEPPKPIPSASSKTMRAPHCAPARRVEVGTPYRAPSRRTLSLSVSRCSLRGEINDKSSRIHAVPCPGPIMRNGGRSWLHAGST